MQISSLLVDPGLGIHHFDLDLDQVCGNECLSLFMDGTSNLVRDCLMLLQFVTNGVR
jgi:hypothetical protein